MIYTYGIVSGRVRRVPENPGIYYRAENEKYLLFFENSNVQKIFRNIDRNYEKLLFKIYQMRVTDRGFQKSERFYYYLHGHLFDKERISDFFESDFTIVEIEGKTYYSPSMEKLENLLDEHSSESITIKRFKDGVLIRQGD